MMMPWRGLLLVVLTAIASGTQAAPITVLPYPASVTSQPGSYRLDGSPLVVFADPADEGLLAAADRFRDLARRTGGLPTRSGASASTGIAFVRDATLKGDEAYILDVTPRSITVRANTDAGLYYGAETLWQLVASAKDGGIAAVHIEDRPSFAWRGVMLDSVRHFQPVGYIEQLLDRMALAKLNVFHWHLTDDQGWRLPVDGYPRLTTVGAWRIPAGAAGHDPRTGRAIRDGGFYTHDEIRAIVAYAAARHIMIVPEIEMPGHATAAIAAYPALASTPTPPTHPSSDWGVLPNLFNTSDQSFAILHAVLDQVMALFPGRYVHIGGDEAPKGQRRSDPREQARLRSLGLKDEAALQGWFTAQIGAYLEQHGRRMVGWDEILEGGVPADATIMSWHGVDGAIAAARSGHDAVLAPAPIFYLDNRQSDSADEPPGRGELVDWKRIYDFDVLPATLSPAERAHVIGVQANLWTEHVRTLGDADRMLWPRAAILAELGWSSPASRDWAGFSKRLVGATAQWRSLGWSYDATPLEPQASLDHGAIMLRQPSGIGVVHFTIDGAAPSLASPLAGGPIPLADAGDIRAQSFLDGAPLEQVRHFQFDGSSTLTVSGGALQTCDDKVPMRLEDDDAGPDGKRPIHWVDVMNMCWIWRAAPIDGARRVSAQVGRIPYNFAFGNDPVPVRFARPRTPAGELEIRRDRCDGPLVAVVPMAAAAGRPGDSEVSAPLAMQVSGTHDLCMTFTQATADPVWVLDRLTLGR
jgi:hexosaminidase